MYALRSIVKVEVTSPLRRLADYVCWLTYPDIPEDAIRKARSVLLHDLAAALGGTQADDGKRSFDVIRHDLGPLGTSTVVGQRTRASVLEAALANCVMMRALDVDDALVPSFARVGGLVVPAALALAEREGSSGREVLTSVVAAYDVVGRMAGTRWTWRERGRDPTHVFGALGVAAAAAKLLRLDPEQTYGALLYAAALGPGASDEAAGPFVDGLVCSHGLTAAYLGRARARVFDGPFVESQSCGLGSLGKTFDVTNAVLRSVQFSPVNLVPVRLLKLIVGEHRLRADDVDSVKVVRPLDLQLVPHAHATSGFEDARIARASLPFALAATLVDGDLTGQRLDDRCDPRIQEQAAKIEIELVEQADRSRHRVEVRAGLGRTRGASGDRFDLTDPEPMPMLLSFAGPVIGTEKARTLAAHVNALEYAPSLEIIAACLRP